MEACSALGPKEGGMACIKESVPERGSEKLGGPSFMSEVGVENADALKEAYEDGCDAGGREKGKLTR